jgi:hypothetical protein
MSAPVAKGDIKVEVKLAPAPTAVPSESSNMSSTDMAVAMAQGQTIPISDSTRLVIGVVVGMSILFILIWVGFILYRASTGQEKVMV